jgi:hypothetical protein
MFAAQSRYAGLPVAELAATGADGEPRPQRYVTRRLVPRQDCATPLQTHVVMQGERLDTIAARYLGDPTQFWRVCDANGASRPGELVQTPGRTLSITLSGIGEGSC